MIDFHTHCHQPEHWGPEWDAHWRPVYGREAHAFTPADYDADKAEAEKTALVNKVVEAELLTKDVAEAADIAVLNALLEKAGTPTPAMRVNGAYKPSGAAEALLPKE